MKILTIQDHKGDAKQLQINYIPASQAWALAQRLTEFQKQRLDAKLGQSLVLEVMAHVTVLAGDTAIPLTTSALVDNHIANASTLDAVFKEVLDHNGITGILENEKSRYWEQAGAELANAFLLQLTETLGPVLKAQVAAPTQE